MSDLKGIIISESDTQTSEDIGTDDDDEVAATFPIWPGTEVVAADDRTETPGTKRHIESLTTALPGQLQIKQARTPSNQTPGKTPIVGEGEGEGDTQDPDNYQQPGEENKIFKSIADNVEHRSASGRESVTIPPSSGGKRLNKRQSKQKSQKRNPKNKTKRISYIKHKQTRKNKHSKKTKSKRSNKK